MRLARHPAHQRGFTLIEAMIALLVMAFGMLALAGMQSMLSRNADNAKQRTEAMRLAQEKMERLRSYTAIATNGGTAWDDLASGTESITPGNTYADGATIVGNTSFTRSWSLGGSTSDGMRAATVTVTWTDRASTTANASTTLSLTSVISKTDPTFVGSLGFPLPANTNLKRPKNRSLNIPVPAIELSGGQSAYQLADNFAVIFSNDSGYVVQKCDFQVQANSDLSTCTNYDAYIVAGYVSRSSTSIGWPTGMNTGNITTSGAGGITCTFGDAVNQNTSLAIGSYKYYLCVVPVTEHGNWSGTLRLGGLSTTGSVVACRFQYADNGSLTSNERNVQPYSNVTDSLDNQNYYLTTTNSHTSSVSCPTVDNLPTTLHQDCRSAANYSANTSAVLAASCPAATPNP